MLINDRLSTVLTQHAGEMAFVQRSLIVLPRVGGYGEFESYNEAISKFSYVVGAVTALPLSGRGPQGILRGRLSVAPRLCPCQSELIPYWQARLSH